VNWGKTVVFCPKCGTKLDEGTKFCSKCGMMVGSRITRAEREPSRKAKGKPLSTLAIVAIIIIVVVVIAGLLSTVLLLGGWSPFGAVVGSGNFVTEEKILSDFTIVDVGSGFNVEISNSSSFSVLVTADDNVMEYIEVSKSGDTLKAGIGWGTSFSSVTLKIKITMPEINRIELSGGSQGKIEDFSSTNPFVIDLSGGSQLTGQGAAGNLTIDASGGSKLHFASYSIQDAYIELSGGSEATINLDGALDADLSGGSTLYYYGDPTLGEIETSSGSQITKK
jgi:predicted nucleic acid-binding Zn ribbon protein